MSDVAVAAGAVAIAGVAVACGALGYLHLAPTGLSPARSAVSQYGISPYRAWYRVLTVAMGVAGGAVAVAIAETVSGSGTASVVVLVSIFAVCRVLISWFPMDAPGAARTSTGAAHGLLAVATFWTVAIAGVRLGGVLEVAGQHSLATASRDLGWAMVAFAALMLLGRLGPDLRRLSGAIQRAEYAAILAWLVVVAVSATSGHLGSVAAWHHVGSSPPGHMA